MSSAQPQAGSCPQCGQPVRPGSRFCMNCAYDLAQHSAVAPTIAAPPFERACPNCGSTVSAAATFCGNCGKGLSARTGSKRALLIGGIAFIVLAAAAAGAWFFFLRGGAVSVSFAEKLLATMPDDVKSLGTEFSLDGTRVAYIARKTGSNKMFVFSDGKPGKEYDAVRSLVFSHDGSRVGYAARDGDNAVMVINGEETKLDYGFDDVRQIGFTPNNTLMHLARNAGKSVFMIGNQKKGAEYDEIAWFAYTLDGSKLIYGAKNKEGKRALVVNDKVVAEGDVKVALGPGGKTFVYVGVDKNGKEYVVIGERKLEGYDNIGNPVFSPDAKLFFAAIRDGKQVFVKDGKEEPLPDELKGRTPLAASSDGTRIAYEVREGGKTHIAFGDNKGEAFDSVLSGSVIFSPDGSKVAYVAMSGGKRIVVVGDQKSEEFDEVFPILLGSSIPLGYLSFNSIGTKVAFGARKGKDIWWKVMDVK